jgi:hypothetical protein
MEEKDRRMIEDMYVRMMSAIIDPYQDGRKNYGRSCVSTVQKLNATRLVVLMIAMPERCLGVVLAGPSGCWCYKGKLCCFISPEKYLQISSKSICILCNLQVDSTCKKPATSSYC